jgi:vacuolar-type H+-ATPase subunit I/STV1
VSTAAPPTAPEVVQRSATDASGANVPNAASAERMIVYTVQLGLEVQDTEKAVDQITNVVKQFNGYVAGANLSRNARGKMQGTITVRVPAQSLDAAQKQIEALGLKVLTRNQASNDVTDQYIDLNARLTNLQAYEAELTKLLATVRERTGKAEDILAVYNQLTQVRGQIEQIKGQMNVLEKTSTLATLTIQLTPHEEVEVLEPDTWMPNKTAAQALKTLVQALQGIADLTIWLALFILPVLIVLALPLVVLAFIARAMLKRRKKVAPAA